MHDTTKNKAESASSQGNEKIEENESELVREAKSLTKEEEREEKARRKAEKANRKKAESKKISFESELTREEATNYLEALIRGVYAGKAQFRQGDQELELVPDGAMTMKVKASRKGDKEKFSFELSWRTPSEDDLAID